VVDAYYQVGVAGRLREFAQFLHPELTTTAPSYLPWGGFHPGAAFFRDDVLPNLPNVLDFGRFGYDVFLAENDRVAALRRQGSRPLSRCQRVRFHTLPVGCEDNG
jgi:ketosteroid isomerase-like protein